MKYISDFCVLLLVIAETQDNEGLLDHSWLLFK